MPKTRPDLIVPIRDRRQGKRYLTVRNVFFTGVAVVVAFAAITLRSEMEPKNRETFGDLVRRQLPAEIETKPVEVVTEAAPAIVDETAADPMLVAPAAREQWLHDSATTTITPEPAIAPVMTADVRGGSESRVAIVGGPEGVAVVQQRQRRPTLKGGFGR